jgi:Phosphotransferase enzyme family
MWAVAAIWHTRLAHSWRMDRAAAEDWIRAQVDPVGPIETAHERPWATVLRVPLADGVAWFKACGPVQAFEPRLTAELFARWPNFVSEVLGYDEEQSWLLLADAGTPIGVPNNTPEAWLAVLPRYAELQRGETAHTHDHLEHHVPDLRVATFPARYEDLLRQDLQLDSDEIVQLARFAARFGELCVELERHPISETVQHDDLHAGNLYAQGERLRVLDWGDASISHPFASLVVKFRFLEEINNLAPADPWFARLRDAYLEPWGPGLAGTFALAMRVGAVAHVIPWARQRDALPEEARARFDTGFRIVLRRAVAGTVD